MTRLASLVLVVHDLERALAVYEQGLGFTRTAEVEDVPSLGARHVLLRAENCILELLEPHDDTKPPGLFLRQRGEGVFALTIGADDPGRTRERLAGVGVTVVQAGDAEVASPMARCYLRPRDAQGVLVEVGPTEAPAQP
jgi:catechol 2,3-dioxygenase-like lactoylglutathione lyase family enzyme